MTILIAIEIRIDPGRIYVYIQLFPIYLKLFVVDFKMLIEISINMYFMDSFFEI